MTEMRINNNNIISCWDSGSGILSINGIQEMFNNKIESKGKVPLADNKWRMCVMCSVVHKVDLMCRVLRVCGKAYRKKGEKEGREGGREGRSKKTSLEVC